MKKAILFDFDGTLVDTQHWYNVAISTTLSQFNNKYTVEYCADFFDGRCWHDAFAEISKEEHFKQDEVFDSGLAYAKELIALHATPTIGAIDALEILQQTNIQYGICSNSHTDEIEFVLEKTQLKKYFPTDVIFGRNFVKTGKPSSDIYLLGLEKLNVEARHTIAVEDSINGARASINAGITTMIFSGATSFCGEAKFHANFQPSPQMFNNMQDMINFIAYAK